VSVKRVNSGRGHKYVNIDTGARIPGVTTIIGDGVPKPALVKWAAESTSDYALDHWDDLAGKAPSVRRKELMGARYASKNAASNKGTTVHKLAAKLIVGERVAIPDGLEGHVQSYVRFLDEFDVLPMLVEAVIVSHEHGYCGTLDLVGDLLDPEDVDSGRTRWLLDIKTSGKGVYGDAALQLAGYRYADAWVDDEGLEQELPEVEQTGAVWVRPDGYDLVPVLAGPAQHRALLYAQQVAEFCNTSRDLVGEPIVSHRTSTFRLVRDDG
jgi:hypothetical protein